MVNKNNFKTEVDISL